MRPPPRPVSPPVAPLAADRFRVQFTATRATRDRLREAQDLLRREIPDGDLDAVIGRALTLLVRELRRQRFAATARPRTCAAAVEGGHQPHLPAAVRRAVAERDGYQCAYVDAAGHRCAERARLEFHHHHPRGRGGGHVVDAIALRCQAHHGLATEREYGAAHVVAAIAARRLRRQLSPGKVGATPGTGAAGGSAVRAAAPMDRQHPPPPGAPGGAAAPTPAPPGPD